jgi:hypothetical protein
MLHDNQSSLLHAMPTFMAGLIQIGAPMGLAWPAQLLIVAVLVVTVWRTSAAAWDERSVALVLVATLLASPYAFIYDMPMLTAALVLEGTRRHRLGLSISVAEMAVVALLFVTILAMTKTALPFVAPGLLALVFGRMAFGGDADAASTVRSITAPALA